MFLDDECSFRELETRLRRDRPCFEVKRKVYKKGFQAKGLDLKSKRPSERRNINIAKPCETIIAKSIEKKSRRCEGAKVRRMKKMKNA